MPTGKYIRTKSSHRKGKTLEEEYGIERAKEIRAKYKKSRSGQIPWNKDKKDIYSEETRKLMGIANKGKRRNPNTEFKKGSIPWNKGREDCVKPWLGKKRPEMTGEKHPNWRGGYRTRRRGYIWQLIRNQILFKYDFKCIHCGKTEDINVHHTVPYRENPVHHIEQLVPLCRSCHTKEEWKIRRGD